MCVGLFMVYRCLSVCVCVCVCVCVSLWYINVFPRHMEISFDMFHYVCLERGVAEENSLCVEVQERSRSV